MFYISSRLGLRWIGVRMGNALMELGAIGKDRLRKFGL